MTPMIDNDDELLVLYKLVDSTSPIAVDVIGNKAIVDSLINKGFVLRDTANLNFPNQAMLSPTPDGRWKCSNLLGGEVRGFTKTPRRIERILKKRGLI